MRTLALATLALAPLVLAGCPASTTATTDASVPDDATPDAFVATDALPPDADLAGCAAYAPPDSLRGCTNDTECALFEHQSDCCGSLVVRGVRREGLSALASTEAACRASYPACGCDSGRVTVDDGSEAPVGSGSTAVIATCDAGLCTTHVRAMAACGAETCTSQQVCVPDCSGIDAGVALGAHCVNVIPACVGATDCSCFGTTNPCPTGACVGVDRGAPICRCA